MKAPPKTPRARATPVLLLLLLHAHPCDGASLYQPVFLVANAVGDVARAAVDAVDDAREQAEAALQKYQRDFEEWSRSRQPKTRPYFAYLHERRRTGRRVPSRSHEATEALHRLRLTAYASEVGESLRPVISSQKVLASYAVSWAYVLADIIFHGAEQHESGRRQALLRSIVHSSLFHTVATMLLPALIVHGAVHACQHALHALGLESDALWVRWAPTAVGMAVIPFIPKHLDEPMERWLHAALPRIMPGLFPRSFRRWYGSA